MAFLIRESTPSAHVAERRSAPDRCNVDASTLALLVALCALAQGCSAGQDQDAVVDTSSDVAQAQEATARSADSSA